ncbi:hypothetical protein RSAG8_10015, partial [Rhizoctonia solani AG-8 WAC10335]
ANSHGKQLFPPTPGVWHVPHSWHAYKGHPGIWEASIRSNPLCACSPSTLYYASAAPFDPWLSWPHFFLPTGDVSWLASHTIKLARPAFIPVECPENARACRPCVPFDHWLGNVHRCTVSQSEALVFLGILGIQPSKISRSGVSNTRQTR